MLYTRDMVHTYSVPDSLEGLPEYKKQAFMLAASGITPWLLTLNYNGVGDMDEYTDSSSELRSVGDDTVPTVEEKVTEQQGGDQLYEDAVESLRQSEAGEQPTPREELRMKPEEQQGESINYVEIDGDVDPTLTSTTVSSTEQGEPVCAQCGHKKRKHVEGQETDLDGRPTSGPFDYCQDCVFADADGGRHPFEPTPPSSKEAEARRAVVTAWESNAYSTKWPTTSDVAAMDGALDVYEAAIRRPLEEERDRLLVRLRSWQIAAGHADEAAKRNYDRAEAAEAQVAKLREALTLIEKLATFNPSTHAVGGILQTARDALATPPSSTEGTKEGDAG